MYEELIAKLLDHNACIGIKTLDEAANVIDELTERHGRWIREQDELWSGGWATKCSLCEMGYADGAYHEVDEFDYCPNCGARMDKDGDA